MDAKVKGPFVGRLLLSAFVGLVVAVVVWFGIALSTWSVIHGGWSQSALQAYGVALWAVPVLLGFLAGLWSYRIVSPRGTSQQLD